MTTFDVAIEGEWSGPAEPCPATVRLVYDTSQPIAVAAVFSTFSDVETWVWHRDLLRGGLRRVTGHGDAVVWPYGPDHIRIHLRTGEGQSVLTFPRPPIAAFVGQIYRMLPEPEVDRILAQQLDQWLDQMRRTTP